jgi:hypothetical protein
MIIRGARREARLVERLGGGDGRSEGMSSKAGRKGDEEASTTQCPVGWNGNPP